MANSFLVELSNFCLWPFNPPDIAIMTEAQRDQKQEALVVELRQVRVIWYFQLENLCPGG